MVTSSQLEETSAVLQIYRWADSDSDPDFDKEPKAKTPHIVISSEEETPEVKNCTLPYNPVNKRMRLFQKQQGFMRLISECACYRE